MLGRITAIDTGALVASLGTATIVDTGSATANGASLNWGRWQGPGRRSRSMPNGDVVHNDGGNLHYIHGVVATDLPTAGIVEYAPVGGTRPTDSATGEVGKLLSGGRVAVNFTTAQVSVNNLQVGFTNAVYSLSGTASLLGPLSRPAARARRRPARAADASRSSRAISPDSSPVPAPQAWGSTTTSTRAPA